MQIEKSTIEKVKARLKEYYRGEYALKIVSRLRVKHISVTRQQVYNFFNHIPVTHRVEIYNTAQDMLYEAREQAGKVEEMAVAYL